MLDKSIPYYNIIMKRRKGIPFSELKLPQGFSFTKYVPGDERYWAEIMTSVGEFKNIQEGLRYFQTTYLPFGDEIAKRVIFLTNTQNEQIGTITLWWNYTATYRNACILRVSNRPEFQSK